ncbi:hypothetical protein RER_pREL1-01770 (plasmid) [Rhodococcus erythropolis PR4]|uniref:Uncharacterized protein n=1 Tax=Rhodococcus erythropolis (strain PR4 / NBRC 100887) TaxID=234621 RepID=Q3L9J4_RHOE4|nr:hypothetical protein RER_pREL1-01770 [Rhodococcus erythropolis PR4]
MGIDLAVCVGTFTSFRLDVYRHVEAIYPTLSLGAHVGIGVRGCSVVEIEERGFRVQLRIITRL